MYIIHESRHITQINTVPVTVPHAPGKYFRKKKDGRDGKNNR